MDDYRYIVQNYSHGDEIYLFGFSRGSYTVRSLCGLSNNCGILKRPHADRIQEAFDHYKKSGKDYHPDGAESIKFRDNYSHTSKKIKFAGVWDTVGALGIPFSFLGFLDKKDEFYDTKIGPNVSIAQHAMAIDEIHSDFEPTIWEPRTGMNLKQVWFTGVHCNIGGSYKPDDDGGVLSDIPLKWMMKEAREAGLQLETHLEDELSPKATAKLYNSRKHIYRSRPPYRRLIDHEKGDVLIHKSVKERWDADEKYRPKMLKNYIKDKKSWPELVE